VKRLAATMALALSAVTAPAQKLVAPAIPVESQNTAFVKAVNTALELLRTRSPKDFEFAREHVGLIKEVERWEQVGMAVMRTPPIASLRPRDVLGSPTWLASVIVHEACHRFQYVRGMKRHGTRDVPNWEFSGRIAELECLKQQAEALERIGAPAREIAFVRAASGMHYRQDEYGNYRKSPPPGGVWYDPSAGDPREPRNAR
jgi:hypothetical protein